MSKNNVKKLVPSLRFPEFIKDEGWEEATLGKISYITNGKSNAQDHIENGKYPLFDRSAVIKASNNFLFDCEAVIIPGEGMRFTPKYYRGKFDLHQRAYVLKDFTIDGMFAYYSMSHRSDLLALKAVKSTVLSLRLPILQNFPIQIPEKQSEQQKIAACLSSLDEVITAESQKLEVLKEHKKGLLQKLLHHEIRFKREDGTSFSDWKVVNFTDCCELVHGFQFREDHFTENGIPIIKIGSLIDNGCLSFKNATYVDEKYKDEYLKFKLKKGDILMALTGGTLGKVSRISEDYGLIFQNYRVGKFEPKKNAIKDYIYYVLQSTLVQDKVKSLVNEAAQPNLGKQDFDKIQFELPSVDEQHKIAKTLSSIDDLINAQGKKLEALQLHKKGLLQGLFPTINSEE